MAQGDETPAASDRRESAKEAWIAASILLGALGIRLVAWSLWREHPFHRQPVLDAAFYRDLASGTLAFPAGPFLWNPFYPAALKALVTVQGKLPGAAVLIQFGLGAIGAELAYFAARWSFEKRGPALAAAALAALYGPFLFYEGLLLGASSAVFFVWTFLAAAALAERRRSPLLWIPAGLALGAAGLARPTLLIAIPPVALWLLTRRKPEGRTRRLLTAGIFIVAAGLPLLPSGLHNARNGTFQPVALHGGVNFYIGNRIGAGGTYERPFEGPHGLRGQRWAARRVAEKRSGQSLDWAQTDRFWFREGARQIGEDPAGWLRVLGRKTLLLFNAYEAPLDYNYGFIRSQSAFHGLPLPAFAWLLPLAAGGVFFLVWERRLPPPPTLLLAAGCAATLLFFIAARYRLPLAPPLILFAGYGISEGIRNLFTARWTRFALAASVAAAAAVVVLAPVERSNASGSWRLLGDAQQADGRFADALKAYDASIEIQSTSAAWNNKGNVLLKLRGPEDATEAFREALRLDEGNREAWNNLGVALKRQKDFLGAEDAFETAIARFPGYRKPVLNLARMYEELGEAEAAREVREKWLGPGR
jgi:tetratricopeptide (TPR) repeat protein